MIVRVAVAVALIGLSPLDSCFSSKQASVEDAAPATTAAPTAPTSEPTATAAPIVDAGPAAEAQNEADVKRYPDERPIAREPATTATTQWTVSNVRRDSNTTSDLVSTLKKDTLVTKLAERGTFILVLFDEEDHKLMGWVHKQVFTPQPQWDAQRTHLVCPAGQVALVLEGGQERCQPRCTNSNDSQCPQGYVCDGLGVTFSPANLLVPVQFCRIGNRAVPPTVVPDAGLRIPDAGIQVPVDAGVRAADAGRKLYPIRKKQVATRCDPPYVVNKVWCRLSCTSDADCAATPGAKCLQKMCFEPGATP
ncbi:MAG: hypothetical protein WCI05_13575 [Myxococcales bacterium]